MFSLFLAAILGIIQGVTEFLPVSSTAHLLISERILGFEDTGGVFTVMIQLGSIVAVMWLFRDKLLWIARGLGDNPAARQFALKILLATVPTLVAGAALAGFVKGKLYGNLAVIAWAFIVGGIVMLIVEWLRPVPDVCDVDSMSVARSVAVGTFQATALVPGVSRSGGTIIAAMAMRVDRPTAAEFTFFLAMPTMAAAFAHDLLEVRHNLASAQGAQIAVGFLMAFLSSLVVVKPFLEYVRRNGFAPFAWYRIMLGALILGTLALR
jgi:undecaprenyl-diphosphatase